MIYCGVAAALVLLTSFIPTAVYASQFRAFGTANNDAISQNVIDTSTAVSGTLAVRLPSTDWLPWVQWYSYCMWGAFCGGD